MLKKIKLLCACLLLCVFSFNSYSQLYEGDVLIDVNHAIVGGKGLWGIIPDAEFTGPIVARLQYMTSDKFGVGCEISFSGRSLEGEGSYNDTIAGVVSSYHYNYEYVQNLIRFMIRTSWEFVNEGNFSMNWSNSIGYRHVSNTFEAEDNNADVSDLSYEFEGSWPLAARTALGIRYFLTDNIGLNTELGFSGGSFINIGASLKF